MNPRLRRIFLSVLDGREAKQKEALAFARGYAAALEDYGIQPEPDTEIRRLNQPDPEDGDRDL